jgi:hypothetical protein
MVAASSNAFVFSRSTLPNTAGATITTPLPAPLRVLPTGLNLDMLNRYRETYRDFRAEKVLALGAGLGSTTASGATGLGTAAAAAAAAAAAMLPGALGPAGGLAKLPVSSSGLPLSSSLGPSAARLASSSAASSSGLAPLFSLPQPPAAAMLVQYQQAAAAAAPAVISP